MRLSARPRPLGVLVGAVALATLPALAQLPANADPAASAASARSSASTSQAPAAPKVGADDHHTIGDPVPGLPDIDLRTVVGPLASQLRAAAALPGIDLRWNRFGTPSSILGQNGPLASVGAADPVAAARGWLRSHASLFGLPVAAIDQLELVNAQELAGSPAKAVLFRQRFGALSSALGGQVTVGVSGGRIHYVSSSLSRTIGAAPDATLNPLAGWLAAARNVGLAVPNSLLARIKTTVTGGWTRLTVPGFDQEQQARLVALPLPGVGVRPVIESNVVQVLGGSATAYTVSIDAISGKVLSRINQVHNSSDAYPFTGAVTADACGPKHPVALSDGATRSITAVVAMVNPLNDVTVKLFDPEGELLVEGDLLTSPELATYSASSIPAGTYSMQVCPFEGAAFVAPGGYVANVSTSDSASPTDGVGLPNVPTLGVTGNPAWRYFTANPSLDYRPGTTPRNTVIGCYVKVAGCSTPPGALANKATPGPWDHLVKPGVPSLTTIGNNANTHEAWVNPLAPGGLLQAPVSPIQRYTTNFTDQWNNKRCSPLNLVPGGNDINFVVGNLFVAHNRMHDYSYNLGFTEKNYNLQLDNLGRGGRELDQEIGNAQAGALTGGQPTTLGRDNANQIALADGIPGITNQYLFQPLPGAFYSPCADGSLDMSIVGHEYTHAISNRMVGGPDEGLTSEHGGAMGESWSDLIAQEYLFSHGYSNGTSPWTVGPYATGNKAVGIRDYAIDKNPLNFSDYGFDTTGVEVHADGEIWNGTMWEVRQALVKKYDARFPYRDKSLQLRCSQPVGKTLPLPVTKCPGNRRWVQLMFDSFLLQQGATSMLDARDAMIAADRMRFGGANTSALWGAFARRGMGKDAKLDNPDSGTGTPSFRSPRGRNATVTFRAPQGRIYVGAYEARVRPAADTVKKTTRGPRAQFAPGTYRMLYVSPYRGFKRFTMTVRAGERRAITLDPPRNLAGSKSGARVLGATAGSRNPGSLIDGTEATNWGGVTAANVDSSKPGVAVDLAGRKAQTIRRIQVSAMLRPAPADPNAIPLAADPDSGSRFTALRRFRVDACVRLCTTKRAKWRTFFVSKANAFPAQRPRPVAPDLTLRSFATKPTKAKALRLIVLENQCTGYAGYAGEQDNDPLNDTDCKTASDRGTIVHAAEFQAFTR